MSEGPSAATVPVARSGAGRPGPGPTGFVGWGAPAFFGTVTVLATVGGLLLRMAAYDSGPLRALAGAGLATLAVWMTSEYLDARWWARRPDGSPDASTRRRWRATVLVSLGLAAVVVVAAELASSPELAFAGSGLLVVGTGPLVAAVRGRGDDPLHRPDRWVAAGGAIGALGLAGALVVGLTVWTTGLLVVGLFAYGRGLEHHVRTPAAHPMWPIGRFPGRCGREPVIGAAVGLAAVVAGGVVGVPAIWATGGWFVVLSLMAIGVAPQRFRLGDVADVGALVSGVLLVGVAGWSTWTTGVAGASGTFLVFIVLLAAVTGATLIWRLEAIFGAVLLGFVFVWGLAPFTVADDDGVSGPGRATASGVVAVGDSYISGEGAERFFDGTDQRGDDRNECRRAPSAYPALLAGADDDDPAHVAGVSGTGLDFLACSGATMRHLVDLDDLPPGTTDAATAAATRRAALPCDPPPESLAAQYPCGPSDVCGDLRQLDHLAADRTETRLVLVSIGGNDAGFGEVVTACLLPGSCADRRELWLQRAAALGPDLEATYGELRNRFDASRVPIVVMPYPLVMTAESCGGSPFDSTEHEFVTEFTTVLNQQIEAAAARAGVHFFADGIFAFDGRRVCESDAPAVNLIALQPTDGPLAERFDPSGWTHNSMHPNGSGHRLMADRLADWLGATGIVGNTPANPAPDPTARVRVLDPGPTRPVTLTPATVADLADETYPDACDPGALDVFATSVDVIDQSTASGVVDVRVPVAGADAEAPLCVTGVDGRWQVVEPSAADGVEPDDAVVATVGADGLVFLRGGRPGADCIAATGSERCEAQWVVFTEPGGANAQLRQVSFCTLDPSCPDSIDAWTAEQLDGARRAVLPPLGVVVLGGWLAAFGVARNRDRLRMLGRHLQFGG